MSYIFSRFKRKIYAFSGIFDPCIDATQMANNWGLLKEGSPDPPIGPIWDQVTAPGGAGGLAHRIYGDHGGSFGLGRLTPFTGQETDRNLTFPVYSPYKWKYKAEFRMWIAEDYDATLLGGLFVYSDLLGGHGFWLDGVFLEQEAGSQLSGIAVMFNVTNQKIGIMALGYPIGAGFANWIDIVTYSWSGSLATWYDTRVYWEYDFFIDPTIVTISAYSSDTLLFSYDLPIEKWKRAPNEIDGTNERMFPRSFQGRCGFGADFIHGAPEAEATDVYFKDILITLENPRLLSYKWKDSILRKDANIQLTGSIITTNNQEVNKGTDIQIFRRASTSDNWSGRWRGAIREIDVVRKNQVKFIAEGLAIEFMSEKSEDMTLTTKTTAEIVIEALNNPAKKFINTTAYFDSVSTTYNRYYPNNPKIDILMESAALEGFIEYFDIGNNFHFQSIRSNYSEIHLEYGVDRIFEYNRKNITIRKPNRIRVNGSGVYAVKQIIEEMHTVGSDITREFNRPDLTVQADVDDALDYYASVYRKSIEILTLKLVENYQLQKGTIITVTLYPLGIYNTKYLLTDIASTSGSICTINLLEVSPQAVLYLAELGSRTSKTEGQDIALDTIAASPQHNFEGVAGLFVSAEYEIEYDSTVVRSGKMTIVDDFIDDLLDVINGTTIDDPTHIAIGTGTDTPQYTDTILGTESTRAVGTPTKTGVIMDFNQYKSPNKIYYHKIKFERVVSSPSGITELGLFNAASSGTMACRAAFASYSQAGSVTFRVILKLLPQPASTYISFYGVDLLITWLYDGSWTDLTRMYHAFTQTSGAASPFATTSPRSWFGVCYVPLTLKTLNTTVLQDLDQVVFEYVIADFDKSDECDVFFETFSYSGAFLLTSASDPNVAGTEFFALAYFLNEKKAIDYNTASCKWRMIIEIKRGEITQ